MLSDTTDNSEFFCLLTYKVLLLQYDLGFTNEEVEANITRYYRWGFGFSCLFGASSSSSC